MCMFFSLKPWSSWFKAVSVRALLVIRNGQKKGTKEMLLTAYEKRALETIKSVDSWSSVGELGGCRLSTLNKLVEKGFLERIRRPGPYIPNESILFRPRQDVLAAISA